MATQQELYDDLVAYTVNDEDSFVDNLPNFVRASEERIWYFIQVPKFKKAVTGVTVENNEMLNVPSDFLAMALLGIIDGPYKPIDNKDESYLREVFPDPTATGRPRVYAQMDDNTIILAPVPDTDYALRMTYFYKPPSLTLGTPTNTTWLSTRAYEVLKYGALMEAAIFMKKQDTPVFDEYEKGFQSGLVGLKNLGEVRLRRDINNKGGER